MITSAEVMEDVATLMNDTARRTYKDAAVLPYLRIAMKDLANEFQLNDIPISIETSDVITLTAGVTSIGFTTDPKLPDDLLEIICLWERTSGTSNQWVEMEKRFILPQSLENQNVTQFLIYAWNNLEIRLIASTADIDLKIDYIRSVFPRRLLIEEINVPLRIQTGGQYLVFHTASLCSMYVGENETRAQVLDSQAREALDKEMGIPIKGTQQISTRRRPFGSSSHFNSYSGEY
jgi:2C-methyl-D-erythritol 2,4-cyclodiphosphate synthase